MTETHTFPIPPHLDGADRAQYLADLAHTSREGSYVIPLTEDERSEAREHALLLLDELDEKEELLQQLVKEKKAELKTLRAQLADFRREARTGTREADGRLFMIVDYDRRELLEVDLSGRIIYRRPARGAELQLQLPGSATVRNIGSVK